MFAEPHNPDELCRFQPAPRLLYDRAQYIGAIAIDSRQHFQVAVGPVERTKFMLIECGRGHDIYLGTVN